MDERLAGAKWIKSSPSNGQAECVEVAFAGNVVGVRDSKNAAAGALVFASDAAWRSFMKRLAWE